MMAVYSYRIPGLVKAPAEVVGSVCAALEAQGRLDAKSLVEVSRSEDAPLHGEFEWDDAVAGEKWRLHQAKAIISNIVVRVDGAQTAERAFVAVERNGAGFRSLRVAMSDPYSAQCLLEHAKSDMEAFRSKYATLRELADVLTAMEDALAQ